MLNPENPSIELPVLKLGPSDDVALKKEDFELPAEIKYQRSLQILQRFSNIAIGLSAYELIYGALSLASVQNSFNIISTSVGFVSLLLSITLSYWSSNMLKSSREGVLDPSFMYGGKWEKFYQALYTVLMLRVAASIPMIANMLFQRDYTAQQLRAFGLTNDQSSYLTVSSILSSLAIPLPLFELFLGITFVQGARKFFGYIQEPSNTTTRMVHIGNVVLMASALGLVYYTHIAKDYVEYYHLAKQFPIWGLNDLIIIGAEFAILSLAVWLVNHFKWKGPHVGVTILLVALTTVTIFFAGNAFGHGRQIYKHYQDTSDLSKWQDRVQVINPTFIENFGCPSKYLPADKCESSECLNTHCAHLFGGLQANPSLQAGNCGLIAISSSLMILTGFLFSWHIGWRDVRSRSKRDYKWLGLLVITIIAFASVMITHKSPFTAGYTPQTQTSSTPVVHEESVLPEETSTTATTSGPGKIVKPNQGLLQSIGDTISNKVHELGEQHLGDKLKDFITGTDSPLLADEYKQQITNQPPAEQTPESSSSAQTFSTILEELGTAGTVIAAETTTTTSPSLVMNSRPVSPYADAFKALAANKYRFLTLKHDSTNPQQIRILAGPWDMSFDQFTSSFDKNSEEIGFVYLGEPGQEKLYMIISSPSGTDSTQVLEGFQLPADLNTLGLKDVNTFVSEDVSSELIAENIIANSSLTFLTAVDGLLDDTMVFAADGSDQAKLWDRIKNKDNKYEIMKKDWLNPNITIFTTGNWTATFQDFISGLEPQHDQVGFIYIGSKGNEQLYMVVYHPLSTVSKVLDTYQLPSDTGLLRKYGVPKVFPYSGTSREAFTLKNIITKSSTDGQVQ